MINEIEQWADECSKLAKLLMGVDPNRKFNGIDLYRFEQYHEKSKAVVWQWIASVKMLGDRETRYSSQHLDLGGAMNGLLSQLKSETERLIKYEREKLNELEAAIRGK